MLCAEERFVPVHSPVTSSGGLLLLLRGLHILVHADGALLFCKPVVLSCYFIALTQWPLSDDLSWAAAQTWEAAEDIRRACEEAGVQFMDGTMWVHSRRAAEMAGVIKSDLGQLKSVNSAFAFPGALVSRPPHATFHSFTMLVEPSGAAVRCA